MTRTGPILVALALAGGVAAAPASAHEAGHGTSEHAVVRAEQTPFGIAGDPHRAARTIAIDMSDAMRFSPSSIRVRNGETVRLRVTNKGATQHEMVLGTMEDLRRHAEMMRKFPDMEHAEAFIAHVAPGETGEIVWKFNRPGQFHFACLVPGHLEAGMIGRVVVESRDH